MSLPPEQHDTAELRIFISAVSEEFAAARERMHALMGQYGALMVQERHPTDLWSGEAIRHQIDQAHLVICLVGYQFGLELRAKDRPADAEPGCSWTQWECLHALHNVKENFRLCAQQERSPDKRIAVFIDNRKAPSDADPRQMRFRDMLASTERGSFKGLFLQHYVGEQDLHAVVQAMIDDRKSGLAAIQYCYWNAVKRQYRAALRSHWRHARGELGEGQDSDTEAADMSQNHPAPFIESRHFAILEPQHGQQLCYLKPEAFLPGRDTKTEALARDGALWRTLSQDNGIDGADGMISDHERIARAILQNDKPRSELGKVTLPYPTRLCVVSGSGVGKTATLQWLHMRLNQLPADADRLALLLNAADLEEISARTIIPVLLEAVTSRLLRDPPSWQINAIRTGLARDFDAGKIVLLIDGLDHAARTPPLLCESQLAAATPGNWSNGPIVLAGRPQALREWTESPGEPKRVCARYWRFLEPAEFEMEEAELYLERWRFKLVKDHLGLLVKVPRILEYVRRLSDTQLRHVRTVSDIYYAAVTNLVTKALEQQGGPHAAKARQALVERMLTLLSALGFVSLCQTADALDPWPSFHHKMSLSLERRKRLHTRLKDALGYSANARDSTQVPAAMRELDEDLGHVMKMSLILGNGILEEVSADSRTSPVNVMWANRTVQQFFAALWLSCYARGHDAVRRCIEGKGIEVSRDPSYDSQRMRHYVFFPEADLDLEWDRNGCPNLMKTDSTYEFNVFLAEMPPHVIDANPLAWIAAASAWYDPTLFSGDAAALRLWPTEMLYRSWQNMFHCAGRPLDDWWDTPYEKLSRHKPGRNRHDISLHAMERDSKSEEAVAFARSVIAGFLGHFETVLQADETSPAHEMIAPSQWVSVPGCPDFMMGAAAGRAQGCPTGKVTAYWKTALLDPVQSRQKTPHEAADMGTWPEWFAGPLGQAGRLAELAWLQHVLEPLRDEDPGSRSLGEASPAYQKALAEIKEQFQTEDETPAQNPQAVRGFEMHRFPVLYRWFEVFAPGHRHAVQAYLASLPDMSQMEESRRIEKTPQYPGGDHPVTYTSWFDAWAFCQWVNWRDRDSGTRYGLRLPHEPEWEFAARWHNVAGKAEPSPPTWRWWWGDTFYADEDAPTAEMPHTPWAHADGRPGCTRNPAEATPNGLGFYDILGNVWEWCANVYSDEPGNTSQISGPIPYSRHTPIHRPPVNSQRTMRGGLWYYLSVLATCTNRFRYVSNDADFKMGFRVVREPRNDR